jgi:hypothetical protein
MMMVRPPGPVNTQRRFLFDFRSSYSSETNEKASPVIGRRGSQLRELTAQ